jgi:hypothetical protein
MDVTAASFSCGNAEYSSQEGAHRMSVNNWNTNNRIWTPLPNVFADDVMASGVRRDASDTTNRGYVMQEHVLVVGLDEGSLLVRGLIEMITEGDSILR